MLAMLFLIWGIGSSEFPLSRALLELLEEARSVDKTIASAGKTKLDSQSSLALDDSGSQAFDFSEMAELCALMYSPDLVLQSLPADFGQTKADGPLSIGGAIGKSDYNAAGDGDFPTTPDHTYDFPTSANAGTGEGIFPTGVANAETGEGIFPASATIFTGRGAMPLARAPRGSADKGERTSIDPLAQQLVDKLHTTVDCPKCECPACSIPTDLSFGAPSVAIGAFPAFEMLDTGAMFDPNFGSDGTLDMANYMSLKPLLKPEMRSADGKGLRTSIETLENRETAGRWGRSLHGRRRAIRNVPTCKNALQEFIGTCGGACTSEEVQGAFYDVLLKGGLCVEEV